MQKKCKLFEDRLLPATVDNWAIFLRAVIRTNEICFLTDSNRFYRGVVPTKKSSGPEEALSLVVDFSAS